MTSLNVFLGWSGAPSLSVAMALHDWLPLVINAVRPWLSGENIRKGSTWFPEVIEALKEMDVGIFCLTRQNLGAEWIHFEAGAIAANPRSTRLCTYLLDVDNGEVGQPLGFFQHTCITRTDTWRLVQTLNTARDSWLVRERGLARAFRLLWPELEQVLRRVLGDEQKGGEAVPTTPGGQPPSPGPAPLIVGAENANAHGNTRKRQPYEARIAGSVQHPQAAPDPFVRPTVPG
jgi:hypothetical protein